MRDLGKQLRPRLTSAEGKSSARWDLSTNPLILNDQRKYTHFYCPYPRASANVQNISRILADRRRKQSSAEEQSRDVMREIESLALLLIEKLRVS